HALLALAAQHHCANGAVCCEMLQSFADGVCHRRTQDVERACIADRDMHDAARIARNAAVMIEHFHRDISNVSWTARSAQVDATSGPNAMLVKRPGAWSRHREVRAPSATARATLRCTRLLLFRWSAHPELKLMRLLRRLRAME